ncbi:histidine triad (HIT) family protein [Streptococcus rupicaprae]|uniref:HIT family protein n=2 Tax=Streptococcus TaxID=1301 RepID=A0A7X6S077_9STRE|nr:HIT family protein [Streptococcus ovuberis]NKZ19819.1 HIT family protein [Streptococcus ovuberis]
MACIFCALDEEAKVIQSKHFFAVWDIDPIQQGHLLVIAKEHRMALAELSVEEGMDLLAFQKELIGQFELEKGVLGVTLATNNGALMDSGTHFHSHLIPRYDHDGFWEQLQLEAVAFDKAGFVKRLKQSSEAQK